MAILQAGLYIELTEHVQEHSMKTRIISIALVVGLSTGLAYSQFRFSDVGINASNTDFRRNDGSLSFPNVEQYVNNGGVTEQHTMSAEFDGNDTNGNAATMRISGTALAQGDYGLLRTSASATLENSFYNVNNDPYYNSQTNQFTGRTPDIMNLYGYAGWSDRIRVGSTATNYYSTWIFHVSGNNSGSKEFTYLQTKVGNNASENFYYGTNGAISETVRVSRYIVGGVNENVDFSLFSTFQPRTQFLANGQTVSGASLFGSTVTLDAVEFRTAPGGQLLTNLSFSSDSGYGYNVVPEPASMTILACGLLALAKKRKSA